MEQAAQVGEHRVDALRDQAGQGLLEWVALKPQDSKLGEPTELSWQVLQLIVRQIQLLEVGQLADLGGQDLPLRVMTKVRCPRSMPRA
jgi:hypothetical protein